MKKGLLLLLCALLLTGCGAQETFETISDELGVSMPAVCDVQLLLPEEAAVPSMESEDGSKLYLCDGYTVTVQTLDGGDLNRTFRELSGHSKDELTVIQTARDGIDRYECVWSAAGEGEDQICRALILDDGVYHYAVTVMANATQSGQLRQAWQEIMDSVSLGTD